MKPSLVLAFAGAIGVGAIGGAGVKLVSSDGYTVAVPPPASTAPVLSEAAAAEFVPLDVQHFLETHIIPAGYVSAEDPAVFFPKTTARYCVTSVEAGAPCLPGDHESLTDSDAVPALLDLGEQVVIPAVERICPWLLNRRKHPKAVMAHVKSMGVEQLHGALYVVGDVVVPSLLQGMPPGKCPLPVGAVRAPKGPEALVAGMIQAHMVPAVKAQRNLR
jgi:hypothetical protein